MSCFIKFKEFPSQIQARLREGEQPFQKKEWGRLIHVSDFINEDGRLLLLGETSCIIQDGHKVIYPGSSGDPLWDAEWVFSLARVSLWVEPNWNGESNLIMFNRDH